MNRTWLSRSLLLTMLLSASTCVFAQDDTDAANIAAQQAAAAQAAQRQLEEDQEAAFRELTQAELREFIHADAPLPAVQLDKEAEMKARFEEFRMAVPKFRAATKDYGWMLSQKGNLAKPLKELEAQTRIILRYFSATKTKHPRPDPSEFKSYSPAELQWETLNSAERIATALEIVVRAERADTISTKLLEFRYKLDGELLRLQWLTEHGPKKS